MGGTEAVEATCSPSEHLATDSKLSMLEIDTSALVFMYLDTAPFRVDVDLKRAG